MCPRGAQEGSRGFPNPVPEVGVIIMTLYYGQQNSSAGMHKTLGTPRDGTNPWEPLGVPKVLCIPADEILCSDGSFGPARAACACGVRITSVKVYYHCITVEHFPSRDAEILGNP